MTERTVITGVGAVTRFGVGASTLWRAAEGTQAAPWAAGLGERARRVAVDPAAFGVADREAWLMGTPGLVLLAAAREALAQAALAPNKVDADHIAFFVAMGMVDPAIADLRPAVLSSLVRSRFELERFFSDGYRSLHPLLPLAMLNNVAFCQVCSALGVRGENAVFSPAKADGVVAIAEAAAAVAERRTEVALAGGVGEKVSPLSEARARMLGELRDEPHRQTLAEGGGVLVLEPAAVARARGAHPLAVIAGWGFACREGSGEARSAAVGEALDRAGIGVEVIDLVIPSVGCDDSPPVASLAAVRGGTLVPADRLGDLLAGAVAVNAVIGALALAGPTLRGSAPRTVLIEACDRPGRAAALLLAAAE